jgi:hypothetical protein
MCDILRARSAGEREAHSAGQMRIILCALLKKILREAFA